jgi:hypothetical protein
MDKKSQLKPTQVTDKQALMMITGNLFKPLRARSLRPAAFQREKLADCSMVARQNETPALVSKLSR